MPEENPQSQSRVKEVELRFRSRIPGRQEMQGIHHVLDALKQVERRIERINRMAVSPQGFGVVSNLSAQAAAQNAIAAAVERTAVAQARLSGFIRQSETVHAKTKDRVTEVVTKTGPGRTVTTRSLNDTLESTKTVIDHTKAQKEQQKVLDDAVKQKEQQIQSRVQKEKALSNASDRANREEQKRVKAEQKHIQTLHKEQQTVLDDAIQQGRQALRAKEFRDKVAELQLSGYRRVGGVSKTDEKTGRVTTRDLFERIEGNQRSQVSLTSTRGPGGPGGPGRFISGSMSESSGPRPRGFMDGFTPTGFGSNLVRVAGWASAVTALYTGVELTSHAVEKLVNVGAQTARLEQVFSKVGGSAQDLTDDVIKLAAANGRATDEAMDSAIAWSRLGLNRVQVNEAVRASLMAANIAELSAGEATKYLSGLFVNFNLKASELASTLGILNSVSNRFNVTNADLLQGIARVGPIAKQTGMSLATLTGVIGATVGQTGRPGAETGNALKTLITRLGDPEIQDFLRNRGLEVTKGDGTDLKSSPELMDELFLLYRKSTPEQRAGMLKKLGGSTQSSRLAAMFDAHIKAGELAITSQLDTGSAEAENKKILDTIKSQSQGIVANFDRYVVQQGNATNPILGGNSANQVLTGGLRAVNNAMRLYNRFTQISNRGANILFGGNRVRFITDRFNDFADRFGANKFEPIVDKANRLGNEANANSDKARLLRTTSAALGFERDSKTRSLMAEQVSTVAFADKKQRDEFLQLEKSGNISKAQAMLSKAAEEASKTSVEKKREEVALRQSAVKSIDDEVSKLKQSEGNAQAILELEAKRRDLLQETSGLLADIEDSEAVGGYQGRQQEVLDFLAKQKVALETIDALYRQMPGDTMSDQLSKRALALKDQEKTLEDAIKSIDGQNPKQGSLYDKAREQMKEDLRGIKAERAAVESSDVISRAELFDRGQVSLRFGQNEIAAGSIGEDEAERLVNQQREVDALITKRTQLIDLEKTSLGASQQALLALQAITAAEDLRIKRAQMIVQLETGRLNLIREQQREYNRSLLLASPSDLLRKIAVKQLSDSGRMNLGAFLSMSPEARREAQEYNPDINPRVLDYNRQLRMLGNRPSIEEDQDAAAAYRNQRVNLYRRAAPLMRGAADEISPNAKAASAALDSLRDVAGRAAQALGQLRDQALQVIKSMVGGSSGTPKTAAWHPVDNSVIGGSRAYGMS